MNSSQAAACFGRTLNFPVSGQTASQTLAGSRTALSLQCANIFDAPNVAQALTYREGSVPGKRTQKG